MDIDIFGGEFDSFDLARKASADAGLIKVIED
jgi:hypothetical protein